MFGKLMQAAINRLVKPASDQHPVRAATGGHTQDLQKEFNRFRDALLGMPGFGPLEELVSLVHRDRWTKHLGSCRKLAKGIHGAETRGLVFDCLCALAEKNAWTAGDVEAESIYDTKPQFNLALLCMHLSSGLIDEGFPLSAARIENTLKLMAANLPWMGLKSWAYGYQISKLGIIRDMQKAVKSGAAMTPAAKAAASQLLDLVLQLPKDKNVQPELKDNAVIKALRDLAGQDRQQTFFQRMLAAGNMREHDFMVSRFTPQMLRAWNDILAQCQTILKDYLDYKEHRKSALWVTGKAAFEAALGDHPNYLEHNFGWWLEPQPAGARSHPIAASLLGKVGTDRFPALPFQTPERFAEICKTAAIEDAKMRFSARASNIMDIGSWDIGGRDSDGLLLSSFENAAGGAPSAGWKKTVSASIRQIGIEHVASQFDRWIGHLDRLEAPTGRHSASLHVSRAYYTIKNASGSKGEIPETGAVGYDQAIFSRAWNIVANSGGVIFVCGDSVHAGHDGPWQYNPDLSDNNETVACGIAHATALLPAEKATPLISRLLDNLMFDDKDRKCRNKKVITACCHSLGEIATPDALALLGKVRRHIPDKSLHTQIDKALANAGSKEELSLDDMKDRAMASHGVDASGRRVIEIEGWRAELSVESTRKATLKTVAPGGKVTRGIAKAFMELAGGREAAQSLQDSAADIEDILPEARRRLERSYRNQRQWPLSFWRQHLAGNGLVATMVSRLIWRFTHPSGEIKTAMWQGGALRDQKGAAIELSGSDWTVTLWHPVNDTPENVDAWRKLLVREKVRQPFLQAWRPVYIVTDAELATRTYSNRFAAHVLEQAPAMAILKAKDWQAVNRVVGGNNASNARVRLLLPAFGLSAEYWVAGVGNRLQGIPAQHNSQSNMYAFVATDRLAFYKLEDGKSAGTEAVPIAQVPAMALSEAMLDVDNIVARTSIGNDRHWKDEGAAAQHPAPEAISLLDYRESYRSGQSAELAATRRAFLGEVLPGLEIANCCTLGKDHLLVDGKHHSYKINLTSGGIHIAPNDRYLCIVPAKSASQPTLLPFEDDTVLSIIISKAMLLADEDQITDWKIRSQLGLK